MSRLAWIAMVAAALAGPAAAQPKPPAKAPPPAPPQQSQDRPIARAAFLTSMDSEFRKMDADKDGRVTKAELVDFERATSILALQARNRALFARLDSDRNGQLTRAEFARLVVAPPAPNVAPKLAKFDLNKDQSISLVEYRTGTLDNFDRLDRNKDGYVSTAELKAAGIGK